jgi:hypothetical protein
VRFGLKLSQNALNAFAQLAELRAAADQIQIIGARYPEAQDRMTNRDAPPPSE